MSSQVSNEPIVEKLEGATQHKMEPWDGMTSDDVPGSRQIRRDSIERTTGSRPNVTNIDFQVNKEPYAEKSEGH